MLHSASLTGLVLSQFILLCDLQEHGGWIDFGSCERDGSPCSWFVGNSSVSSYITSYRNESRQRSKIKDRKNSETGEYIRLQGFKDVKEHYAQLTSPLLQAARGSKCAIAFYYRIHETNRDFAELNVVIHDDIHGEEAVLKTYRTTHGIWVFSDEIDIGYRFGFFQVILKGTLTYYLSYILIDDIVLSRSCRKVERPTEAAVLKLVGGLTSTEGRIEVYRKGLWGTVCDDEFGLNEANVVCRQIGYANAERLYDYSAFGRGRGKIWMDHVQCQGNETDIEDCIHGGWGSRECDQHHRRDVGVVCSVENLFDIRLRNGTASHKGRLEVKQNHSWGAVNSQLFGLVEARVACRQLGFADVVDLKEFHDVPSYVNKTLEQVQCQGNEISLAECNLRWGGQFSKIIALECTDPRDPVDGVVRLVGGVNSSEGVVEVFFRQKWGTICRHGWDDVSTNVVCSALNFGPAKTTFLNAARLANVHRRLGRHNSVIWLSGVSCHSNTTSLRSCSHHGVGVNTSCLPKDHVAIACTDFSAPDLFLNEHKELLINYHGENRQVSTIRFTPETLDVLCRELGFLRYHYDVATSRGRLPSNGTMGSLATCRGNETSLSDCADHSWFEEPWMLTRSTLNQVYRLGHKPVTCSNSPRLLNITGGCNASNSHHTLFETRGLFWSPLYPNGYPEWSSCAWNITAKTNYEIVIKFTDLSLSPGEVMTVSSPKRKISWKPDIGVNSSGSEVRDQGNSLTGTGFAFIRTKGNKARVRFVSQGGGDHQGGKFRAIFYVRELPGLNCRPPIDKRVQRAQSLNLLDFKSGGQLELVLICIALVVSPLPIACLGSFIKDCSDRRMIRESEQRRRMSSVDVWLTELSEAVSTDLDRLAACVSAAERITPRTMSPTGYGKNSALSQTLSPIPSSRGRSDLSNADPLSRPQSIASTKRYM